MMSYLWGDGRNSLGEVGAEPSLYSICNIKPSASHGHLNLHEPHFQRECLGLKELEAQLLLTGLHHLQQCWLPCDDLPETLSAGQLLRKTKSCVGLEVTTH